MDGWRDARITGWMASMGSFIATCGVVHWVFSDSFLGAPTWAWGIAAALAARVSLAEGHAWMTRQQLGHRQ